ncbi:hypothetical protein E2C01_021225 [Portunus trituberculatus]|uniref:Uncharacterized protein n=1 Tax=Portunus trituberculatus TaxID=210409 RepID=A0A5B7E1X9_PORTR|nr:hypothetical protein [Portunus trituberculatus]
MVTCCFLIQRGFALLFKLLFSCDTGRVGVFPSTQELQCGASSLVEVLGGEVWPEGKKSSGEPGVFLKGA